MRFEINTMSSNTKEIKRRIKSISNTMQVTKALELISSVKMRKAIAIAAGSRDFAGEIWQLIAELYPKDKDAKLPRLFAPNTKAAKTLLVAIASDKGLAGSYNANVMRKAKEVIGEINSEIDVITVGKKANKVGQISQFVKIISVFEDTDEEFDFFQVSPISKIIIDEYIKGKYNKVVVVYTNFINTLKQVAVVKTILPIGGDVIEGTGSELVNEILKPVQDDSRSMAGYKYEPDKMSILGTLGRLAVRSQIYQALLEASASEHAARMVAMKSATENGNELVSDLRFTFNQLRQQGITQEIAEISAGRIALGNA